MFLTRSILLYLAVFAAALFLFWLSERKQLQSNQTIVRNGFTHDSKTNRSGLLFALSAVLLISLFAGLRATSVGADTQGYPVVYTNIAKTYSSFFDFLNDPVGIGDEPLGALAVWLCARLDFGIVPLLFVYQLLTVGPVYFAVRKYTCYLSTTIAMAIYLFFFFNNSLNMMRQSVTCAFLFFAFACYLKDRRISLQMFLAIIAGCLFHRSAIYGLLLIGLSLVVMKIENKSFRIVMFLILITSPLLMTEISQWLVNSGLADEHMKYYLDVFVAGNSDQDWNINPLSSYSLAYLIIYTVLNFTPYCFQSSFFNSYGASKGPNNDRLSDGKACLVHLSSMRLITHVGYLIYIVLLFSLNTMYGIRFSIYLDFFLMLTIPSSCEGVTSLQKKLLLVMALVTFWFIWIIRLGWSASTIYLFFFE